MKEVERLPLKDFTRYCMSIAQVPSSYLSGLTIEEQLLWLCSFLTNEVIPTVNNNGEAVEELQNLYRLLKDYVDNYFDNLDIQEEVNTKLEEMAQSGELAELISQYLEAQAVIGFNTCSGLAGATNLADGSFARTLGRTTYKDGYGAFYKIRERLNADVPDGYNIIELTNTDNLVAERIESQTEKDVDIIKDDPLNVKLYGAKGDGITDDTQAIQDLIDDNPHKTIYFPDGKYLISSPISIKAGNDYQVNIEMCDNAVIFANESIESLIEIGKVYGGEWSRYEEGNVVHINGGLLDCENATYGIYSNGDQKSTMITNVNMINVDHYGIYCDRGTHSNVSNDTKILNCNINGTTSATENEGTGIYLYGTDNTLDNITMLRMKIGFDITGGGNKISNVHVCTSWLNDSISDSDFNNTIAFKYTNANFESLSNIYLDTYSTGFSLNGNNCILNISNVVSYYWYAGNANIKTKFIDVNTTISSNNRLFVNNVNLTFPESNGRNNVVFDLDNAGSGYREFLTTYGRTHFNNIEYAMNRISSTDYINVMQLRKEDGATLNIPWSVTMVQNQYYPIALVNRGFHEFNFRHDNSVYSKVVVDVAGTISSSTLTTTNIKGGSGVLSLNLLDIGLTDIDNRPLLVLAEKCSGANVSLNPCVDNVKSSYFARFYSGLYFPTNNDLTISSPTVIATSTLNH